MLDPGMIQVNIDSGAMGGEVEAEAEECGVILTTTLDPEDALIVSIVNKRGIGGINVVIPALPFMGNNHPRHKLPPMGSYHTIHTTGQISPRRE